MPQIKRQTSNVNHQAPPPPGYKNTKIGVLPVEWEVNKLKDICTKKISYGIVQAGPHVEEGQPYIKSSDLNDKINPVTLQRTSWNIAKKYQRSTVLPGDIVFSLRGNIGVSAIVPETLPEANLTQGTARITSAKHSNDYLINALQSEPIRNRINSVSKGSTFKEISLADLRNILLPLPPPPRTTKNRHPPRHLGPRHPNPHPTPQRQTHPKTRAYAKAADGGGNYLLLWPSFEGS
jgi:restriction endonuclease S subunit